MRALRVFISALSILMPWPLRRVVLNRLLSYRIHPTARIGLSLVMPDHLRMAKNARIGHLNLVKGLQRIVMGHDSSIGNLNWVSAHPAGRQGHFAFEEDRAPDLVLAEHSAITNRHLIDCTNTVDIGCYTTVAGFRSQILTHSIDLERNVQASEPVRIGKRCFAGSGCVILPGSCLPDFSVLGAQSMLNKCHTEQYTLFAGVPAKPVAKLDRGLEYFHRVKGYVQ